MTSTQYMHTTPVDASVVDQPHDTRSSSVMSRGRTRRSSHITRHTQADEFGQELPMGDESLFYRPKSPLLSTVVTYLGGPTPSKRGYPAVRFDLSGVEYHESYGQGVTTSLGWKEVRAVALLPGPVEGRLALCVYPLHDLPEPDISVDVRSSGTAPRRVFNFRRLFGTPIAVHWHHVRGPSPERLAERLPGWTDGRITLTSARPV
jgi:hypothetical protein